MGWKNNENDFINLQEAFFSDSAMTEEEETLKENEEIIAFETNKNVLTNYLWVFGNITPADIRVIQASAVNEYVTICYQRIDDPTFLHLSMSGEEFIKKYTPGSITPQIEIIRSTFGTAVINNPLGPLPHMGEFCFYYPFTGKINPSNIKYGWQQHTIDRGSIISFKDYNSKLIKVNVSKDVDINSNIELIKSPKGNYYLKNVSAGFVRFVSINESPSYISVYQSNNVNILITNNQDARQYNVALSFIDKDSYIIFIADHCRHSLYYISPNAEWHIQCSKWEDDKIIEEIKKYESGFHYPAFYIKKENNKE